MGHDPIAVPDVGRFISEDPLWGNIFDPQSLNRFAYGRNNPYKFKDPTGRAPYAINRQLGGDQAFPSYASLSHGFIADISESGEVKATYSWGNTKLKNRWGVWTPNDKTRDLIAAEEAYRRGWAVKLDDDSLDPYMKEAFEELNQKHKVAGHKWRPWNNCRHERNRLMDRARELRAKARQKEFKRNQGMHMDSFGGDDDDDTIGDGQGRGHSGGFYSSDKE